MSNTIIALVWTFIGLIYAVRCIAVRKDADLKASIPDVIVAILAVVTFAIVVAGEAL